MVPAIYILISLGLSLAYAVLMAVYFYAWRQIQEWNIPPEWKPASQVTVLIPARNEANNIEDCLRAILRGSYPRNLLEILVLDDHSEDETAAIVWKISAEAGGTVRLLQMANRRGPKFFGKKNALEWGVSEARAELIVTTDADCIAPPDWLRMLVSMHETRHPGAVVAPVAIHRGRNLLQHFQALDLAGMMGITGAGLHLGWHIMGNGANLCYSKTVFQSVGGFEDSRQLASGDDFFLLQKIARREPVLFLKNNAAAVQTEAPANWPDFLRQRLRWGTKSPALKDWGAKLVLGLVLICSWSIILNMVFWLAQLMPFWLILVQVGLKAIVDYFLLKKMCHFFGRKELIIWFWPAFCLHILYIAAMGLASLVLTRYTWKGRKLR